MIHKKSEFHQKLGLFSLFGFRTAPFDDGKTLSNKGFDLGFFHLDGLGQRLVYHKYAKQTVGRRGDRQGSDIGICFPLECNEIIWIMFHSRNPIYDKFIVFFRCKTHFCKNFLQKFRGIFPFHTITAAHIIPGTVNSLPKKIGIFLSVGKICKRAIGSCYYMPAVLILGIGAGKRTLVIKLDGNFGLLFGIKINDGLCRYGINLAYMRGCFRWFFSGLSFLRFGSTTET